MPGTQHSRRKFLNNSLLAAASPLAFPAITRARSPNSRLNLVFIGVGGRGAANIQGLVGVSLLRTGDGQQGKARPEPTENVVAICDVNAENLDKAGAVFKGAKRFRDFRKLFESLKESEYDGVVVSTTEHTHAYATLPALKLKKPVYCEKPLTRDVAEARMISQAAAAAGVATQMGTQIHGMPNYRRVVELVQTGAIGKVNEVHVCVSRAWGLQSQEDAKRNQDIVYVTERPKEEQTPRLILTGTCG